MLNTLLAPDSACLQSLANALAWAQPPPCLPQSQPADHCTFIHRPVGCRASLTAPVATGAQFYRNNVLPIAALFAAVLWCVAPP